MKTAEGERVSMRELIAPWVVAAVIQILGEFRKFLVKCSGGVQVYVLWVGNQPGQCW